MLQKNRVKKIANNRLLGNNFTKKCSEIHIRKTPPSFIHNFGVNLEADGDARIRVQLELDVNFDVAHRRLHRDVAGRLDALVGLQRALGVVQLLAAVLVLLGQLVRDDEPSQPGDHFGFECIGGGGVDELCTELQILPVDDGAGGFGATFDH